MANSDSLNEDIISEKQIYIQYQEVICPFIAELEVQDKEYPIEIFNEIRSIFTHIARYKISERDDELRSASGHVKRAILDCFKYSCISCAEKICDFKNDYSEVDLSLADNGNFLPNFNKLEAIAQNAFKDAKKVEIEMDITTDELYGLYEKAYNSYVDVVKFIDDSREAISFASTHSKKQSKRSNKQFWIGLMVGASLSIISIILSVIFFIIGR